MDDEKLEEIAKTVKVLFYMNGAVCIAVIVIFLMRIIDLLS